MAHDRATAAHALTTPPPTGERLQKLLARAGLGSRRSCEALIAEGRVTIDGRVATLGERADPASQQIALDGQLLQLPTDETTLVLNKPSGYVVSTSVEEEQHSVYELLPDAPPQLRYVGRLDSDSEGVLLFTTIGDLVHRLTHPRYEIDKVYEATVHGRPSEEALDRLRSGVPLEDGWTAPAQVEVVETRDHETLIKLVIHEGRKRQIRRMCRAIEHPVRRLRRTAFGPLTLQGLAPGESRTLGTDELAELMRIAGIEPRTEQGAAR